uniref:UBX domain-containing protein 2A n=1 Tax=Lygus hesperus TaxID=30085 RepID=A0A0A9ZED2_LYGHE
MNNDEEEGSGTSQAFFGRGRRLGFTANPSPFMHATVRQRREVSVLVYKNGFLVNDELFVPLDSEDGVAFVQSMDQGYVPPLLASHYPDNDIDMKLTDMREKTYTASIQSIFTGTGHRLASNTTITNSSLNENVDANMTQKCYDGNRVFAFDNQEASTSIRLVTTTGRMSEIKVNTQRHTVEDLYLLAHQLQP